MAEYISDEFLHTGEYISRDDTLKAMQYSCQNCDNYNGVRCKACADADNMDIVSDMPAADAQSVKHGRWSECYTDTHHYSGICSVCGKASIKSLTESLYEYCPKCGARMDGDTNG